MNSKFKLITGAILFTLILGACASVPGLGESDKRTVSVNGTGKVVLTPDMATISIGVNTQNVNAKSAVSTNNRQAAGIIDALDGFGIAEEDIKTTNFSVFPRQDFDRDGNPEDIFYVVQNTVLVTVRDLDVLGEVLDAAVRAGANQISGINFDVADRETAFKEAMEAAVMNARERAEIMAVAAGAALGEVQTITTFVFGGGELVSARGGLGVASLAADVPIAPGQTEISVEVQVVYELESGD